MPKSKGDEEVRVLALQRISCGMLPDELPASSWAGPGEGNQCTLCDEPITADEIEIECENHGRTIYLHQHCYDAWQSTIQLQDHLGSQQ